MTKDYDPDDDVALLVIRPLTNWTADDSLLSRSPVGERSTDRRGRRHDAAALRHHQTTTASNPNTDERRNTPAIAAMPLAGERRVDPRSATVPRRRGRPRCWRSTPRRSSTSSTYLRVHSTFGSRFLLLLPRLCVQTRQLTCDGCTPYSDRLIAVGSGLRGHLGQGDGTLADSKRSTTDPQDVGCQLRRA
jgi:hypothetical protein